jgi:proton-dependent oligopeptide transporter, POT family
LVNPLWVAVVMLLFTMGEVMVAPVGLAMISRAAPVQMVSLLMGVALFANAVANYLAGTLEHYLKNTGWPLYEFLSVSTIGCGALLMLISPLLWRLMKLNQTSS